METRTQDVPGYYIWEVLGKPLSVYLHIDVIDRLLAEVMRGFGAVPRRGAEVGGILIGTVERGGERGDQTIVRVEDFEPVPCSYKRGPSYLFTDEDGEAFNRACERWQQDGSRAAYAVGMFRSHTRDGMALSTEDVQVLNEYFPGPSDVALLIKPFATKASPAGFFFREEGAFQEQTPLEFPFRRWDLLAEEIPPMRRSRTERQTREKRPSQMIQTLLSSEPDPAEPATAPPEPAAPEAPAVPVRSGLATWLWIPLSFIFLLLGVALGFEAATSMGLRAGQAMAPDFSLRLNANKMDDNLTVRWNSDAPAVRNAQRGVLEIQDGDFSKPVELDPAHLQNGSIIYRNTSNAVHFRLIVYLDGRLSVTETLNWRQ
jgi:hypothetical protein